MKKPITNPFASLLGSIIIAALLIPLTATHRLVAQTPDDEVKSYIQLLEKGEVEQVRKALPDLTAKYQNNAGVIYLEGRLATNGIEAVKFYQSVVDNFPKCEWADDALYRIYQYYQAMGLTRTAEAKLQQLNKDYPNSPRANQGKADVKPAPADDKKPAASGIPEHPVRDSVAPTAKPPAEEIVVRPRPRPAPPVKQPAAEARFTLQVGAFSTSANAEKQKSFFEERGYRVEVTNKVRNGRSYFLVWVGSYATSEEAKRVGRDVRSKYKIDSMVVEKQQ